LNWLKTLRPDNYVLLIVAMVVLASLLPIHGAAAHDFGLFTKVVIALLFFLHGARLSREAVIAGLVNWRLHLVVLGATFLLFPLLGLILQRIPILPATLSAGVLFLCCLPSTVQSSIAFTSVARGDIAAAVCAASASNLFGIFITPVIAGLTLRAHGAGFSLPAVEAIVVQLLLPFLAGQVARLWIADWIKRHARITSYFDRGSILLVVYGAFSEAVTGGIWKQVSVVQIVLLALVCAALLGAVLAITAYGSRLMGFSKEEEITIVFCGSKKSLASGVPMAGILFPPASVGLIVLPLMVFHQIQLMACAVIAQRYAARPKEPALA
jgi:sodium/bile acid cotransporter 7